MFIKNSLKLKLILSYVFVALVFLIAGQSWVKKPVMLSLFFTLAAAVILGIILAGSIVRRIKKMAGVCRKFSEGDFSQKPSQYPQDEIGELAASLNTMAQEIEDTIRKVKSQHQQLEAVFNSMAEGVVVTDKSGRIISLNPAVERIFGVARKDAEGRLFLEAIRNNELSEIISSVLKTGQPVCRSLILSWPVQAVFEAGASAVLENGAINGCLLVLHDITEIRRLETVRRDFVANVSHELKTPLTSIKGFVETLLEGALEDKDNARQFLQIILEHSDRLNSLINDLLELSRIESREIRPETSEVELKVISDNIISGFITRLKKKAIKLDNELPAGLTVKVDPDMLAQVFINLIDNAIKFNKHGGAIKISGSKLEDNTVKVTVEDSGAGIPAKDLSRIFERFYRVDKARSRELGGTGLGLSIVKHIIELHSGKVGVESIEGAGSKFWFIIPR